MRIILDNTIQYSMLSFITYNIHSTPAFGFVNGQQQRRLLSGHSEFPNTAPKNTSMMKLTVFVQQSVNRIHFITGTCRATLQLCVLPLEESACIFCARLWWLANFTLTTTPSSSDNAEDDAQAIPFFVRDTDLLDARHATVMIAHNPALISTGHG